MVIKNLSEQSRFIAGAVLTMVCVALLPGCVAASAPAGHTGSKWMTEEQAEAIGQFDRRQKMHGRNDIQLRSIAEGDAALVFALVVDDLASTDGVSRDALGLDKYHVLYGLKGDLSLVYFSIRRDAHGRVGLKDSEGQFIRRMTNYPYIEYWVDRRTWSVTGKSEHPF